MRRIVVFLTALLPALFGVCRASASCESDAAWCKSSCSSLPDAPTWGGAISGKDTFGTIFRRNSADCISECTQRYDACLQSERSGQNKEPASPNLAPRKPSPRDARNLPVCDGGRNASQMRPGPAPNRDDFVAAEEAMKAKDSPRAYELLRKIDEEGMAAIRQLPPSLPWFVGVVGKQLDIISWARAKLAVFYQKGYFVRQDNSEAAKWYQSSIETKFIDEENGCQIVGYPGSACVYDYAVMILYGVGVPRSETKARELLAHGYGGPAGDALLRVVDNYALPATYGEFIETDITALTAPFRSR